MENLMTDTDLYQDTIAFKNLSRIPFLEFHLKKLRAVEKHVPWMDGKSLRINFSKAKYLYSIVSQIMQYQQTPYNLQPVPQIAALLNWGAPAADDEHVD